MSAPDTYRIVVDHVEPIHEPVLIGVHHPEQCAGRPCVVHDPTRHPMRLWPLLWRADRAMFERLCEHGVGHPDPDQVSFWADTLDADDLAAQSVHGCRGHRRGRLPAADLPERHLPAHALPPRHRRGRRAARALHRAGLHVREADVIAEPQPCNYCKGMVMFLQTNRGRFMPVDAEPSPNGNVLRSGGHAGVLGPNQAAAARENGAHLHLHHAINCPDASKWQAKGAKR